MRVNFYKDGHFSELLNLMSVYLPSNIYILWVP